MRDALDEHHGGNRRDWSLGLATLVPFTRELPALATGASAAALTGVMMSVKTATTGITVAVAAGSFVAGWAMSTGADESNRAPGRADSRADLVARADYERVEAELRTTRAKYDTAQEKLLALTATPEAEEIEDPGTETGPETGTRFVYGDFKEALDSVDWKLAAESTAAMPPLLEDLADGLREGKALASMGDRSPKGLRNLGCDPSPRG